ncbi:MAG: hypothetical protein CSB13_01135 [Chloroflexi bacterium]|nr:MAG: hypothetical protein CSB13_01135 [Chloroflexota bacterium]
MAGNGVRLPSVLDEIVQARAQQILIAALEAEGEVYIQAHLSQPVKRALAWPIIGQNASSVSINMATGE